MIRPEEIRKKAERLQDAVLSGWLLGQSAFPYTMRSNKRPSERDFLVLKEELGLLLRSSKEKIEYGYRVKLEEFNTKKWGIQKLPTAIIFDDEIDFWKFIGKENAWKRFQVDSAHILETFPELKEWMIRNPRKVMDSSGKWEDILRVVSYFKQTPTPNCYIRELPIQVHTKFVEENKTILENILQVIIPQHILSTGNNFEERFHLKTYEQPIHLRFLDKRLAEKYFSGLTTIGVAPSELARLELSCDRLIILENKASYSNVENFLSLPRLENTIAIFGNGFGSGILKQVSWLRNKELLYWGDIDLHGFEILSMLRNDFPLIRSVMMNAKTFDRFPSEHVNGSTSKVQAELKLTDEENEIYIRLKTMDRNNRLEQEKIPQWYVCEQLQNL